MMNHEENANPIARPLTLAAAAVLGTLATACMMPFVAIATIAAATMPRAQALTAVIGIWLANQLLGFGLLGYPLTGYAMSWGVALGGASVVALLVARRVLRGPPLSGVRLALAFVAAFVTYEGLLFAFALVAGGAATFTPAIILLILGNDAAWLVGLTLLNVLLARAVPRVFGAMPALRLA
jgi:hypothetical protein